MLMILLNNTRLKFLMNSNIHKNRNYMGALSLLKIFILIIVIADLVNFSSAAATVAPTELKPFKHARIVNTPDDFRQKWVQNYQDKPNFGLLHTYPSTPKRMIAIQCISGYGKEKESKEHKELWTKFVPENVSTRLKAVDFLTRAVPLLPSPNNNDLREKVVNSMSNLLTFKSKATRSANSEERKVIIGATIRIALELYNKNRNQSYDVEYWKQYFISQQLKAWDQDGKSLEENKDNKGVLDTINTRATLAALTIFEIANQGNFSKIYKDSKMKRNVFINFINEIKGVVPDYGLIAALNRPRPQRETQEISGNTTTNLKHKFLWPLLTNPQPLKTSDLIEEKDQDLSHKKRTDEKTHYGTFPSGNKDEALINMQQPSQMVSYRLPRKKCCCCVLM